MNNLVNAPAVHSVRLSMTFEDYLQKQFLEECPGTLDDEGPDKYEDWLANLDGEEYINYGNAYGEIEYLNGKIAGLKQSREILNGKENNEN